MTPRENRESEQPHIYFGENINTIDCKYERNDLKDYLWPCGLGIADSLMPSYRLVEVFAMAAVHDKHHEEGHAPQYWQIECTTKQDGTTITQSYRCTCGGVWK
jgi:hypothetical protein